MGVMMIESLIHETSKNIEKNTNRGYINTVLIGTKQLQFLKKMIGYNISVNSILRIMNKVVRNSDI